MYIRELWLGLGLGLLGYRPAYNPSGPAYNAFLCFCYLQQDGPACNPSGLAYNVSLEEINHGSKDCTLNQKLEVYM